jgi:hypothetical protein
MTTCPIGPTCTGCAKCDANYHTKRAAKRTLRTNKENSMTDDSPMDAYGPALKALREATATPESRLEDQWKTDRLRELDIEYKHVATIRAAQPQRPRLTAAELAKYTPPDPFAEGIKALQAKENR